MTEAISRLRALSTQPRLLPGAERLSTLCADLSLACRTGESAALMREATLLAETLETLSDRSRFGGAGQDPGDLAQEASMRLRSLQRAVAAAIRSGAPGEEETHFEAPVDLTSSLRNLPAPPDEGGRAVPTGMGGGESGLGQVCGTFTAITCRAGRTSAPRGAVILPAGAMIRLEAGDAILLHHRGPLMAQGASDPGQEEMRCSAVQAGEQGVEIHGPAILEVSPQGMDMEMLRAARAQMPPVHAGVEWWVSWGMMIGGIFIGLITMGEMRNESIIESMFHLMLSVLLLVVGVTLKCRERSVLRRRRRMAPLASRALSLLRGGRAAKSTGRDVERDIEDLAESVVHENGSLDVFPPGYIVAGPGREVRVMRPLALLPAPAGENVVALRRKKPA